ncbi:hypothetical protein DFH09DRAFT_1076671 [Mycena vulgaris]|nr:hypothetical protein DFH09DRAFT_1076671 [Mycena vulgaris]
MEAPASVTPLRRGGARGAPPVVVVDARACFAGAPLRRCGAARAPFGRESSERVRVKCLRFDGVLRARDYADVDGARGGLASMELHPACVGAGEYAARRRESCARVCRREWRSPTLVWCRDVGAPFGLIVTFSAVEALPVVEARGAGDGGRWVDAEIGVVSTGEGGVSTAWMGMWKRRGGARTHDRGRRCMRRRWDRVEARAGAWERLGGCRAAGWGQTAQMALVTRQPQIVWWGRSCGGAETGGRWMRRDGIPSQVLNAARLSDAVVPVGCSESLLGIIVCLDHSRAMKTMLPSRMQLKGAVLQPQQSRFYSASVRSALAREPGRGYQSIKQKWEQISFYSHHICICYGAPRFLVEALTGDFGGFLKDVTTVAQSDLDIYAHNIETMEELTPYVRDRRAPFPQGLKVPEHAKKESVHITKTT